MPPTAAWAQQALNECWHSAKARLADWCERFLLYEAVEDGGDYETVGPADRGRSSEQGGSAGQPTVLPGRAAAGLRPGVWAPWLRSDLHESPGWCRLVVEKPFGEDLESATGPQSPGPSLVFGVADLSDRPLSG